MDQFPQMLYRFPAVSGEAIALVEGTFDIQIVSDELALEAALGDGWHESSPSARSAHEAALAKRAEDAAKAAQEAANAPPTRSEMEAKATELGLKFDGRTSDAKLLAAINEKLAAG